MQHCRSCYHNYHKLAAARSVGGLGQGLGFVWQPSEYRAALSALLPNTTMFWALASNCRIRCPSFSVERVNKLVLSFTDTRG